MTGEGEGLAKTNRTEIEQPRRKMNAEPKKRVWEKEEEQVEENKLGQMVA